MPTAAAYIRVSTEDQMEFSPDSQLRSIQAYALNHHIELLPAHIYLDEGISGRNTSKRPAFLQMIADAKRKPHPFDLILLWKFSRFARNRQDSIFYKSMLRRECGIDVISITEPLSPDPTSILIEALLEAMDEYYSVNLAQEVRRGMNEKFRRGGIVSIIGELGIFCIFLFSFMILCKNVPPLYPEIRNEWESGIVEAYLNGELEEENENSNHSAVNATDNLSSRKVPAYTPVSNDDTWLSYYDAATKFSCQYPTNWIKIAGAKGIIDGAEPPLLMLVNGGNQLTITALTYDTQKEFEHMKELSLTLPRNAQGEPSEDYQLSNVNINGLPMTKITNPLHIGAPDEPGEDVKQIALHYFQESKKRSFAIVMLVYDEEAETDLNAITSSIQITQ